MEKYGDRELQPRKKNNVHYMLPGKIEMGKKPHDYANSTNRSTQLEGKRTFSLTRTVFIINKYFYFYIDRQAIGAYKTSNNTQGSVFYDFEPQHIRHPAFRLRKRGKRSLAWFLVVDVPFAVLKHA